MQPHLPSTSKWVKLEETLIWLWLHQLYDSLAFMIHALVVAVWMPDSGAANPAWSSAKGTRSPCPLVRETMVYA